MFRSPLLPVLAPLLWALFAVDAAAQCDLVPLPGDPLPQLQGHVDSLVTWDPDGTGPLPLHLVAGGTFDVGSAHDEHVVLWDGTAWTPTGANFGAVSAMTVWNGLLVAAVEESIRTFDGATWSVLASVEEGSITAPLPGVVNAMLVWNGELIVGGRFTRVVSAFGPSQAAFLVAKWNGTAWSAFGVGPTTTGMTGPWVQTATVFNNALWVGLGFSSNFGNTPTLQYFTSSWINQGTGADAVDALAARIGTTVTNSYVFVARHTVANLVTVAGFNPVTATTLGINTPPAATAPTRCQQLFVRGTGLTSYEVACTLGTTGSDRVWRWTAAAGWLALPGLGDPAGPVQTARVHFFGGRYVAGLRCSSGTPTGLRGHDAVAAQWVPLTGPGFDGAATCVCHDGGELVVGGSFTTIAGTSVNRIARGHAGAWQPLGSGFGNGTVNAVARLLNGDLVAGGDFSTLGDGTPMSHIARWNGATWSPLGSGCNGTVLALLPLPNGELIAGGAFSTAGGQPANNIARWNGSSWSPLGSGCSAFVRALLRTAGGDVVAGGVFLTAGGQVANGIARWDGAVWSPFDTGFDGEVRALAESADGIVAGGAFQHSGAFSMPNLARWNGATWVPFGPVPVQPDQPILALATLPGGEVAVGGTQFVAGGVGPTGVAVWRGSAWQSLDVLGGSVRALAMADDGRLALAGDFLRVDHTISTNVATVVSTCPASAATSAAGCPSSGGANTLTALTLPWANGTLRLQATGLPGNALVLGVTSPTAIVPGFPLAAVFAEGVPGCLAHVAPDILSLAIAVGGVAQVDLFLPNTPPIVGVTFYHQMVPIEFDPGTGAWLAITATNALQLTAGIF